MPDMEMRNQVERTKVELDQMTSLMRTYCIQFMDVPQKEFIWNAGVFREDMINLSSLLLNMLNTASTRLSDVLDNTKTKKENEK